VAWTNLQRYAYASKKPTFMLTPQFKSYEIYGLHIQPNGDIKYREWAPNAESVHLIGDFNGWDRLKTPLTVNQLGVWEVTLPAKDGQPAIPHNSKIKVSL
jgi:1,4-alpha-glucan branching enzyme